jgi:3-isopropylmalate dehydratase small subunit
MMQPFTQISGVAVPFLEDDANTDQMAPVAGGARLSENYAETLYRTRRRHADGSLDPDFVFNKPQYQKAALLVSGKNFGCGSSRESSVWVFQAIGIRCIVARSFADIYRENCLQNGVLPIVLPDAQAAQLEAAVIKADGQAPFGVDLIAQVITGPDGLALHFEISTADRTRLIEGLDDIGLTLKHLAEIETWEARVKAQFPWQQSSGDPTKPEVRS